MNNTLKKEGFMVNVRIHRTDPEFIQRYRLSFEALAATMILGPLRIGYSLPLAVCAFHPNGRRRRWIIDYTRVIQAAALVVATCTAVFNFIYQRRGDYGKK